MVWILLCVAAVLAIGLVAYTWPKRPTASITTLASPTPVPTVVTEPSIQPSSSLSPTPRPTSSSIPSPSSSPDSLPASISQTLTVFYAAFKAQNASELAKMFVPDTTPEMKSLNSRLFKGVDTNGIPGGPTLFQTNSAGEIAISYVVNSATMSGSNWQISLTEQRADLNGKATAGTATKIILIPGVNTEAWQIGVYAYQDTVGKYDAFIVR